MAKTFLDLQNLRASKINEASASKILDVDLARFYNEIISDMSKYGQKLKKVTTNIVANQDAYTVSVLPGFVATAYVKINGNIAPFIGIEDYGFEIDRATYRHTVANSSLYLLPVPTTAATNGLEVWYWSKLPEIADGAVAGTALTDLSDNDWNVVVAGINSKCFEKLIIYITTAREGMPDASIEALIKYQAELYKRYQEELDKYGNQSNFFHKPSTRQGPAARENEMPKGIGRQDK